MPARILIVDDQATQRAKMAHAVETLGHVVEVADSGTEALQRMRRDPFDLVLLDILMPVMDGFEVLDFMRREPRLRDIPVIVISALDGELDSVVRAIEAGARDFLPKDFDPILLNARIGASLESKFARDRELQHLARVERLTDAAAVLERHAVDPRLLGLEELASRDDTLGHLSRVFSDMAREIHERQRRLLAQIRTLRGIGLLVALGVVSGLSIPLSRIASLASPHPLGNALWVNILCAAICLPVALYRGRLPRASRRNLSLFLVWGVLGTLFGEVLLFWLAERVEASVIASIVVSEGFLVFALAALLRIERADPRRLLGLLVGLLGVLAVLWSIGQDGETTGLEVALAALLIPIAYACRVLWLTVRLPEDMDLLGAAGCSALASVALLLPITWLAGDFVALRIDIESASSAFVFVVLLLAIASACARALRSLLIRTAGSVFASQSSLVVTLAGLGWSAALLGERLPSSGWSALLLLLVGAALVGPKREAEARDPLARVDVNL